jgi:hypothetical protein
MLESKKSGKSGGSATEIEVLNDNVFSPHLQKRSYGTPFSRVTLGHAKKYKPSPDHDYAEPAP